FYRLLPNLGRIRAAPRANSTAPQAVFGLATNSRNTTLIIWNQLVVGFAKPSKQRSRLKRAGTFSVAQSVTIVVPPAGAGRRGYQDGRHPVASAQQVSDARGCPDPAAPADAHTQIPARWRPKAWVSVPAAGASPGRRHGLRSAARSPRRG